MGVQWLETSGTKDEAAVKLGWPKHDFRPFFIAAQIDYTHKKKSSLFPQTIGKRVNNLGLFSRFVTARALAPLTRIELTTPSERASAAQV